MKILEQLKKDLKKAKILYAQTGYKEYDKLVDKIEQKIKEKHKEK